MFDFRTLVGFRQPCEGVEVTDVVCAIAAGELPAEIVLHTERVIAFLDHRPVFKGHVLVCPLPHVENLNELAAVDIPILFAEVQRIAVALPTALGCTGTFVAINNQVSQSIHHLHVHVVPRTKGDGLRGFFWPRVKYAENEAAEFAARIRAELG